MYYFWPDLSIIGDLTVCKTVGPDRITRGFRIPVSFRGSKKNENSFVHTSTGSLSLNTRSRPSGSHMGMYGLERTYPDSQSSFRSNRTFTFSHLDVRTYVRSHTLSVRIFMPRCDVRTPLKTSVRL